MVGISMEFDLLSILYPVAFVLLIFNYIKRFHDLKYSGGMCFLLVIPIVNLILLFDLFFWKGTQGPNKYGEDPLLGNNPLRQTT